MVQIDRSFLQLGRNLGYIRGSESQAVQAERSIRPVVNADEYDGLPSFGFRMESAANPVEFSHIRLEIPAGVSLTRFWFSSNGQVKIYAAAPIFALPLVVRPSGINSVTQSKTDADAFTTVVSRAPAFCYEAVARIGNFMEILAPIAGPARIEWEGVTINLEVVIRSHWAEIQSVE